MKKLLLLIVLFALLINQNAQGQSGTGCNGGNEFATFTTAGGFGANYILGTKMNLPVSGLLTGLSMKGHAGHGNVKMGLYANNAGVPGALLATSVSALIVEGTNTMAVTPVILAAGDYWVMAVYDIGGNTSDYLNGSTKTVYYQSSTFANPLPASGAGFPSYGGQDVSYWMNVSCVAITNFTPVGECTGLASTAVITGIGFTGATAVTIGGTNATSFVVDSATQITAQVGAGVTGTIAVTTPAGSGTSSGSYTVVPIPTVVPIVSPSAMTACSSQLLTIDSSPIINLNNAGSTLGTTGSDQWQSFVPTISGLTTGISVRANGCASGNVTFTVYSGLGVGGTVLHTQTVAVSVCSAYIDFNVPNLNLAVGSTYTFRLQTSVIQLSLLANNNTAGTTYYSDFYGGTPNWRLLYQTYVKPAMPTVQWFNNGVAIPGATSNNYTAITSGNYTCKNYNGSCYSSESNAAAITINTYSSFACPGIASFSPSSVCANSNSAVVITGVGFTTATAVTIGGTNAQSFTVDSATQITAIVGAGATGTIKVTTPSGYSISADTLTVSPLSAFTSTVTPSGATTVCGGPVVLTSDISSVLDNNFTTANIGMFGTDQWQAFVPSITGRTTALKIQISGCTNISTVLTIYAGTGTAGTVIHTQTTTVTACNAFFTFALPELNLTAGNTYTFRLQSTSDLTLVASHAPTGSFYSNIYGLAGYKLVFQTYVKPTVQGLQWFNNGVAISGANNETYSAVTTGNYTVKNTNGTCYSVASNTATVTINTAPVITCPANQSVSSAQCAATVTYTSTVTGTPAPTLTYTFTGATTGSGSGTGSGATFNKGVTTVTLTITNTCGTANCSFTVTVSDTANPTIIAPGNITTCQGSTIVLGNPVTADNCGVASVVNNAPGAFPVGLTSVLWTVTDTSGNTATAIQTVLVGTVPTVNTPVASLSTICAGGSTVLTATATSGIGNMLMFNGSGQEVHISNLDISPAVIPTLTISSWAKRTGTVSGWGAIVSNDDGVFDRAIMVNGTDNNYHIFAGRDINTGIPSVVNQWDFITVYWSASAVTMWKNGVQVYTTTGESASSSITGTAIGRSSGQSWSFVGSIDQVSLWNTARTSAQILAEMTSILSGNEAGLTAYYKFDEGTGVTTADASPNARTGNINGSPVWAAATEPAVTYLWSPGGATTASVTVSPSITTAYSVTVTNANNCTATSGGATVSVNPLPTIACIGNQSANITAGCSATVTYGAPIVTGTPAPSLTYAFSGATTGSGSGTGSGATFNKGITTVTLTATNSCGSSTCSFTITVTDAIAPVLTCPATVNLNVDTAVGSCASTATIGIATAIDNCGAVASITNNHSGSSFPLGDTTVIWTATDSSGNSATCSQLVHVTDNQNPGIVTQPISVVTNAGCTATNVNLDTPLTIDNCSVASVSNNHPSTTFPLGQTTVVWTVTDGSGNVATANQIVTVTDEANPVIAAPADVVACSGVAVVLGNAIVFDNCSVASVSNNAPSTFGEGTTIVTWTVTDTSGNVSTANQHVTVYPNVTYYADLDQDGFGNIDSPVISCVGQPAGTATNGTDCNDANNLMYATFPFYVDADGDTYGSATTSSQCAVGVGSPPAGYSVNADDCDDTKVSVHPGATEIGYNLIDDDCDGLIDEGFPPKTTVIQGAQCNTTLAAIDSSINANIVSGAQGYRWRITTMSGPNTGQVQFLDTAIRTMKLTSLANYAFATQYKVEVGVYYAGFLQPYTMSSCTVTTPVALTALTACGQTLTNISDPVYANLVPYATGYRFKITDPLNALNTQTIDRPIRDIRMNLVTAFVVQYGKTYNIQVAVKNTDGTYLAFGSICSVTTPVFPTTSLQDAQCDNYAVPTNATQVYAISYPGAISYVFQLTGPGLPVGGVEIVKSVRTFALNEFTGLVAGATYNVKVRLIFNVADPVGPYGKTCTIVTPGASRVVETKASFNAVVFPNPFAENFNIDVTTSMARDINVKVYDMTGRLLETRDVKVTEIESLQVGDRYPSGVYNVIVSQGENVKTLRVIKR
jgi:hypothetical protein